MGLRLCPAEVGPELRLQYQDQPFEDWLAIGMELLEDPDHNLKIFVVEHHPRGGSWLTSFFGDDTCTFNPSIRFVFARRS